MKFIKLAFTSAVTLLAVLPLHAGDDDRINLIQRPGNREVLQFKGEILADSDENKLGKDANRLGNEAMGLGPDFQFGPGYKSALGAGSKFEASPVLKPMKLELPMTAATPPPPLTAKPLPE